MLTSETAYSNVFHKNGGNASFSVMANTLRGLYGTDVLVAPASSFTGSVLQADYTKATVRAMIMPNGLMSYQRTMTGAELKDTLRAFVEGCEGGFNPVQPRFPCRWSAASPCRYRRTTAAIR